ncbi:MAG: hypothetical protein JWM42_917 [Burkholderia sp.]|nr:hypothetical protein [Burkholderia sp.]
MPLFPAWIHQTSRSINTGPVNTQTPRGKARKELSRTGWSRENARQSAVEFTNVCRAYADSGFWQRDALLTLILAAAILV